MDSHRMFLRMCRIPVACTTRIVVIVLVVSLLLCTPFSDSARVADLSIAQSNPFPTEAPRIIKAFANLPMAFEANVGQIDPAVRFVARSKGYSLFLTATGPVLLLDHNGNRRRSYLASSHKTLAEARDPAMNVVASTLIRFHLVGANPSPQIRGSSELPGKVNYLIGNDPGRWRKNIPLYSRVEYRRVYPGIDLVYYGNEEHFEHDFVVHPGADPKTISFSYTGVQHVRLDSAGDLVLRTARGIVRQGRPLIYQKSGENRSEIPGGYALSDSNSVRFWVGPYDNHFPLYIDPVIYCTVWGGGQGRTGGTDEVPNGLAVDAAGNAYVVGTTYSTSYPTTASAFQRQINNYSYSYNNPDAVVTKISADGTALIYSTYLGGASPDYGSDIVVDGTGSAIVVGTTSSDFDTTKEYQFPLVNPLQRVYGGGTSDAFVAKLSPDGSNLEFSTFLGGNSDDHGVAIGLTPIGNIVVAGWGYSSDFPLKNPISTEGISFLSTISPTGSSLISSTKLVAGWVHDLALDRSGNVYITGSVGTDPTFDHFTLVNPFQSKPGGGTYDAYIMKINATASAIVYSSYLGGGGGDVGNAVAVDSSGNAFVGGSTASSDFPVTTPLQGYKGSGDGFVTKINANGSAIVYSTLVGGSGREDVWGIAVDNAGQAVVTGQTYSSDFPTVNAIQGSSTYSLSGDTFLSKLRADGMGFVFSTYLGGASTDKGIAVAVDAKGNSYVLGQAFGGYPYQTTLISSGYFFLAKIGDPDTLQMVSVWQALSLKAATPGQFSKAAQLSKRAIPKVMADTASFIVTYDGMRAPMMWAWADSIMWRVPEALIGPRLGVTVFPNTTPRIVEELVRQVRSPGDTAVLRRRNVRFIFPGPLLYDELQGPSPALVQGLLPDQGPRFTQSFMFIGRTGDGTAAVRLTNTTRANQAPAMLLGKVISPGGTLHDPGVFLTPGNLPLVGLSDASQQLPVSVDGIYLILCEAESPISAPNSFQSPGPFPARFQVHLSGNAGFPQAADESGRATRLDTYFNAPAPRGQVLGNQDPALGQIAQTGLAKFASPVSSNPFPIAVLVPPTPDGYPFGVPPVRARAPLLAGQILPPSGFDLTTPTARTRALLDSLSLGDVIDWSQVPFPASRVVPTAGVPGVAGLFGDHDGNGVTLPFPTVTGPASSIIFDMGSGHEIVNGPGADFTLFATSGSYTVAVSNTPFSPTFVPLNGGNPVTGGADFDLAGSGLLVARYVRVTASPSASIDALKALNQFIDFVHATAGPMVGTSNATMTARRLKSPPGSLNPYLEFIGPDGSSLGKNDSGFGDGTDQTKTDATLVKQTLPAFGFYRFLIRGYDILPDELAFGSYFARLETGGDWDQAKVPISQLSEAETNPQKTGSITDTRQRNSYLFEAQPGSTVKMSVEGGNATPLVDPVLELYDPEDFLIAASDNYTGRGKNPALSVVLPASGRGGGALPNPSTYRIVVSAVDTTGSANALPSGGKGFIRTARAGTYSLKVFTGAMTGGEPSVLQVSSVSPNAVVQGATGVPLKLLGANFQATAQVSVSGSGVTVKKVDFINSGELHATVDIDSSASLAKRDVTVSIPGGQQASLPNSLDIRKSVGKVSLTWDAPGAGSAAPPSNLRSSWSLSRPAASGILTAQTTPKLASVNRSQHQRQTGRSLSAATLLSLKNALASCDIQEVEPNNSPAQAQKLTCSDSMIVVHGSAQVADSGTLDFYDDDIEDLFQVTTKAPGLSLLLDRFTSDCDLYLLSAAGDSVIDVSDQIGATVPEVLEEPVLPAGTYLVGVSIYDSQPLGPDTTSYTLTLQGNFGGSPPPGTLESYALYRSVSQGAKATGMKVASVPAGTTQWQDAIPFVGNFYYQVTALYSGGTESAPSNEVSQLVTEVPTPRGQSLPQDFALTQNYPNPFNPSTTIQYALPQRSHVNLAVFNTLGQKVADLVNADIDAGYHEVKFDGSNLATGLYFYRLQAGDFVQTKKLLILR